MTRPTLVRRRLFAAVLVAACAVPALAVTTQVWVRQADTFRVGTAEGMLAAPEGGLCPGPAAHVVARPETAVVWSVLDLGGDVLAGAGEKAGVLLLHPDGTSKPFAGLAGQGNVFALARAGNGDVFAATGPQGAVYQLDVAHLTAREIFRPQSTYIWSILPLPDGALAVATGLPGKVYRLDPKSGLSSVLWETADNHVRALALGPDGQILAGTAGSGLLVELRGNGRAYTLWDSDRPETVALAVDGRGSIWAAFAGAVSKTEPGSGSGGPRTPAKNGGTVNVTVRPRAADDSDATAVKQDDEKTAPPRATDLPGGGGSLVRIGRGEEPETAWSDDKETPLALTARKDGGALLGTAGTAHVWWFSPAGRLGLFDERKESRAVSALVAAGGDRIVAATSNPSEVIVYGPGAAAPARWTSDVFDAKVRSTIGRVEAVSGTESAKAVSVLVRVGNTSEPDDGWTNWTAVPGAAGPPDQGGGSVTLPRGRFFQVRVEQQGGHPFGPGVSRVEVNYRPVNRAPRIDSVEALPRGIALRSIPPPQMSGGEIPVVPPPRGPELDRALGDASPSWRSKRAYEPTAQTVVWEAKDADGDDLRFRIESCRDEGGTCSNWVLMAEDLDQQFYSFDSRTLPDGVYRFRVTASDDPGNAAGDGRTTVRVSDPVPIDNSPPVIDRADYTKRADGMVELVVEAHDVGGLIVKAEVTGVPGASPAGTISALDFVPLLARDGVGTGARETWSAILPAPPAGQDPLVRVIDAAGNSAARRASAAGR